MKIITISFLICSPLFLLADKIEIKNIQSEITYELRRNGQQIEIRYDGKSLFCSNRKGNRSYRNKVDTVYRASRKVQHITIYNKDNQALYRLSLSGNSFRLSQQGKIIAAFKIKKETASLYDTEHQLIGKVNFDAELLKNKVKNAEATTILSYKTATNEPAGIFLLLKSVPIEVRLILMNEFLDK